ncbi:MAG: 50S ribosomal protein L21 [Bacteroidales bacterium]|jgi:large subunit ribosomal protein L21|nr:50S ribosomal protein L21 [Bacteroidales bacterium]
MYAIVDIAGQQFKVEAGKQIFVNRQAAEVGSSVSFDKVLLLDNEGDVKVGTPYIDGAAVNATVVEHCKADKVIIFKKKRRKGYQKKNGHRQYLTKLQIEGIA